MNRWEVGRIWDYDHGQYVWLAGGPDTKLEEFLTWREAMDYADKMARTVTLPRIGDRHTVTPYPTTDPLMVSAWGTGAGISTGQSDTEILIMRRELKPLALALLAHHYKQELQK